MRGTSPSLIIDTRMGCVMVEAQIDREDGVSFFCQGHAKDLKTAKANFYREVKEEAQCFVHFRKTIINDRIIFNS